MNDQLLVVENLSVTLGEKLLLKNLSFHVGAGEIVAIIGESGSGKSMTAKAILDLLPKGIHVTSGRMQCFQQNVYEMSQKEKQHYRRTNIGFVFQDSEATFDPLQTIGEHFRELFSMERKVSKQEAKVRALRLLANVKLANPERIFAAYPYELSGGMRQRVQLALALTLDPVLLIADEPTTALDTHIQADILRLIKEWSERAGGSVLFITHDLGVARVLAHRVIVMKNGEIVETELVENIFTAPIHEHTKQLLRHYEQLTNVQKQQNEASCEKLITVQNVSKTYAKNKWLKKQFVQAVSDVSFHIQKGEIVGLIGESGSGKSTLSRLLLQLERATSGQIRWHGSSPFRKMIQWVHQNPFASFDPRWTVEKIVGEGLDYWEKKTTNKKEKVQKVLQKVGLHADVRSLYPYELSGGMQQRVAIARALILQPELLILDEPFASLDMSSQAKMLSLLKEINTNEKTAILFISHDIRSAMALCHRIFVMERGELIDEAKADELSASTNFYTIRLLSSMLPVDLNVQTEEKRTEEEREYVVQEN